MCQLLLRDCQFANVLHWYFTLLYLHISTVYVQNIFNCSFVYDFLHLEPSKMVFLHIKSFEIVSDQLHVSLHFMSRLFAKIHEKGYFSHFLHSNSFWSLKIVWVFSIGLYKSLFQSHVKIHFKNCIWVILSQFGP